MIALGMTQFLNGPCPRFVARLLVLLGALGMAGCGSPTPSSNDLLPATISPGANDPLWLTSRGGLPAPDAERIEYDPNTRLLTFHELPGGDRWMVQLPNEEVGRLVGPLHQLPEGIDPAHILVYYARPGARASAPITVAQIEAARAPHTSLALHP
jgi:hypothetical protein